MILTDRLLCVRKPHPQAQYGGGMVSETVRHRLPRPCGNTLTGGKHKNTNSHRTSIFGSGSREIITELVYRWHHIQLCNALVNLFLQGGGAGRRTVSDRWKLLVIIPLPRQITPVRILGSPQRLERFWQWYYPLRRNASPPGTKFTLSESQPQDKGMVSESCGSPPPPWDNIYSIIITGSMCIVMNLHGPLYNRLIYIKHRGRSRIWQMGGGGGTNNDVLLGVPPSNVKIIRTSGHFLAKSASESAFADKLFLPDMWI